MRGIVVSEIILWLFIASVAAESQESTKTPEPLEVGEPVIYPEDFCENFDENYHFDFVVIGSGKSHPSLNRILAYALCYCKLC